MNDPPVGKILYKWSRFKTTAHLAAPATVVQKQTVWCLQSVDLIMNSSLYQRVLRWRETDSRKVEVKFEVG